MPRAAACRISSTGKCRAWSHSRALGRERVPRESEGGVAHFRRRLGQLEGRGGVEGHGVSSPPRISPKAGGGVQRRPPAWYDGAHGDPFPTHAPRNAPRRRRPGAGLRQGAGPYPGAGAAATPPEPAAVSVEEMARRSPIRRAGRGLRRDLRGAGAARGGARGEAARLRAGADGDAPGGGGGGRLPEGAEAWRGAGEVAGAVLLWDPASSTCELRAEGVDPIVVEAEFAKLPDILEEAGSSVMRLPLPPARAGAPRTRQMLLVSPGGSSRPERARVLRLGDTARRDAVALSARGVAAGR